MPDGTRSRVLEVQAHAFELRIIDRGEVIARHRLCQDKGRSILDPRHRPGPGAAQRAQLLEAAPVSQRPLDFCHAVGQRLAAPRREVSS